MYYLVQKIPSLSVLAHKTASQEAVSASPNYRVVQLDEYGRYGDRLRRPRVLLPIHGPTEGVERTGPRYFAQIKPVFCASPLFRITRVARGGVSKIK